MCWPPTGATGRRPAGSGSDREPALFTPILTPKGLTFRGEWIIIEYVTESGVFPVEHHTERVVISDECDWKDNLTVGVGQIINVMSYVCRVFILRYSMYSA